jgi:hypothetical protein
MHPRWRRCSSIKYAQYSQSSRLASGALLLSVFLVWVGYIPTLAQAELLKEDAERAKLRGLTAMTVRQLTEYGNPTLSELIQSRSVVVLRPTRLNVATTVASTTIRTWHVFVIDESLSDRPPQQLTSFHCRGPAPDSVVLGQSEIAIEFEGGTAQVDGVSLTVADQWSFEPALDARYLAFLVQCDNGVAHVPDGPWAWFNVTSDGQIAKVPPMSGGPVDDLLALGTLSQLRQRLPP